MLNEPGQQAKGSTPPIIDLAPFLDARASPEDRLKVAQSWNNALSTIGMCIITNHGVSIRELDDLYSSALEFFQQFPKEEKMKCCLHKGYGFGGYVPQGVEAVGRTTALTGDNKESPPPPDLVENFVFNFGGDPEREPAIPAQPPQLVQHVQSYWSRMTELMHTLMRLSAVALNLPPDYFSPFFQQPKCNLRLAYYAPMGQSSEQMKEQSRQRYGAHTDYTGFTILRQDMHTSGLEVHLPTGEWLSVPPDASNPDALVINAGDLIQVWTNDQWRSPPHRVVNPPPNQMGRGRLSLVFFTGPADETIVEALPGCYGDDRPKQYAPVKAQDHLVSKLQRSNV